MAQPTITLVSPATVDDKETGVVITGTNFEAVQGTGKVEIVGSIVYEHSDVVAQTVTAWADTSITITVAIGTFDPGYWWIAVTNDSGETNTPYPVRVREAAVFSLAPSDNIPDIGAGTTSVLTPPGSGNTFGAGRIEDSQNPTLSVNIATGEYREDELCFAPTTEVEDATQYEFRTVVGGVIAEEGAAGLPKWTVGLPPAGDTDLYLRSDVDKDEISPSTNLRLRTEASKTASPAVSGGGGRGGRRGRRGRKESIRMRRKIHKRIRDGIMDDLPGDHRGGN